MTNGGPNPIAAEAARKALVENDRVDANRNGASASRAALDAQELRELEQSLYASVAADSHPDATTTVSASSPARRSLIARLFRRR